MRSCNGMRYAAAMAVALVSAACGSSGETRPVDGKFRATVEGDGVPSGSVVSVDVYWLGNGSVDVRFDDVEGVLPGPDELKGVVLHDDNGVLSEGQIEVVEGEAKHAVRLEGSIAPDALDLALSATPPGGATATVRLKGDARPFDDADALDGEYLVVTEYYPARCPGEERPPLGGDNAPLDLLPVGGGARLTLDGRFTFTVPTTGTVDATLSVYDRWYAYAFDAHVAGAVAAGAVALTLDVPDPDSGAGCVNRLALTGGKRLPDPSAIDGEYRASYVWRDECYDESGSFTAPISLVQQADGVVDFHEYDGDWMKFTMEPGAPFEGDFYDIFGSWAMIRYEGVIAPPELSYTAVHTFNYDPPCDVTLEVTAYKRYFFPEEE